jgi:Uma2 family endonuclease
MSVDAPRHRYTLQQYLIVETDSRIRHEFLDGEIYAMAGGTPEHAALAAAVIGAVSQATRDRPCRVYTSDLRVRVLDTGLATYPDVTVVRGELQRDPENEHTAVNPLVIVEILGESTESFDRGEKLDHYKRIPSLRECVLVSHRERCIEVWRRVDALQWERSEARSGRCAKLASIDAQLDVDALYDAALGAGAPNR